MTQLSQFIAELIRAANTVQKLTVRQRRRFFGRAYVEIIDKRAQLAETYSPIEPDPATELLRATGPTEDLSDDHVKELLLEAADMLRELKIALDDPHGASSDRLLFRADEISKLE